MAQKSNSGDGRRVTGPRPRKPPKGTLGILGEFDPMESFSSLALAKGVTQQDFLLAAVNELAMTRDQLARRIGVSQKTIGKWMSSPGDVDYRAMSETVWKYLAEILLAQKNRS